MTETSFFIKDGDGYLPTPLARGPWGPSLSGNYVGGLLGRTVEHEVDDVDLQPARLTVDLLRPVALQPLQMHSAVVRDGRRLRLVDAVMTQNDVMVARASALFLRRSEHAEDTVWTSPVTMPAVPGDPVMWPVMPNGVAVIRPGPGFGQSGRRDHRMATPWPEIRVDSRDEVSCRRRAIVALHSRRHGRRCHQFAYPLGYRGIAVHQRRLHDYAQSLTGRCLHRLGLDNALWPRRGRHRVARCSTKRDPSAAVWQRRW